MNPDDLRDPYAAPQPAMNNENQPQPSWQPPAGDAVQQPQYAAPTPPEWQQPPQPPSAPQPVAPSQPPVAPAPQLAPQPQEDYGKLHPMIVMQSGEKVICRIKRHPVGIIGTYIGGGFAVLLAAAVAIFLVPRVTQSMSDPSRVQMAAYGVLALVAIGTAALLSIASKVYWGNEWVVTSDSITQTLQNSLFSQQTAQLSMENLEDVTVDQNGVLQHMFNFGTLHVETAGEHSKFVFPFCPNPTMYARQIIATHEEFSRHQPDPTS